MLISINGIESTLAKVSKDAIEERSRILKAKVPDIVEALKEATPVDTGLARNSWNATYSKDKALIENNVEYIEHLNEGSSEQAPAFFIEKTMLSFGKPVGKIVKVIPS